MNALKLAVLSSLAAVTVGGVSAAPQNQCFLSRNINGFSAPNDRTVYVRVGVKDIWRLDLMNSCTGLTFRNGFGLQGSPTGPWICRPLDATVLFNQTGMRQRCPVSAIHKLTPEEAAALPKRDRP
ncbi:MAG: DUF6491 family protein [Caulobacteraceae bacterium]